MKYLLVGYLYGIESERRRRLESSGVIKPQRTGSVKKEPRKVEKTVICEAIGTVVANLKKERNELENGIDIENPFLATFRKYENIDKLTRKILIELVDHIKIYECGISIRFKFAGEIRRIVR